MSLVSGIPASMGSVYGTSTGAFGSQMSIPGGAFGVGGAAMPGIQITSGAAATGKRESEKLVQSSYATVAWRETGFEKFQAPGQFLFCVRGRGIKAEQLSMATNFQVNSLLRGVHERVKHVALRAVAGANGPAFDPDDYTQIDEILHQLREHAPDIARTITSNGRITDEARQGVANYKSARGICTIWNYLGPYFSDGGREHRNFFMLNVGHQGPCVVDNVFQPIDENSLGPDVELGPSLQQGDSCRFILKRRWSPATQQFEEFVLVPHASNTRYAAPEDREFEDPETGRLEFGPTFHVGRVLDVLPQRPDVRLLLRMRGITTPWMDAYNAHGANEARVKLALGPDTFNYAA